MNKNFRRIRIKNKIRKTINGTVERPRLTVFRSNNEIYAQLIDDIAHNTLMTVSSLKKEIATQNLSKKDKSAVVGKTIAEMALEKGISSVVFDRNGYLYHGRVKILADSAREAGLKF
ncbi:MAG: 50S ribosomal protein L18 [Bacteroidales bacterium]|nr:50S ribosomal protein L18 [Bacteroidales bacterium]